MLDFIQEDEELIFNRFSFILLSTFLYYGLSYYFLGSPDMKKPKFFIYLLLLILHILHVVLLKFLHYKEEYALLWLSVLLPLVFFIIYSKYSKHQKRKRDEKKQKEEQEKQSQKEMFEASMPNRKPQQPTTQPSQNIQYVGLNNNTQKAMTNQSVQEMKQTIEQRTMPGHGVNFNQDDIRGVQQIQGNNIVDNMSIPPERYSQQFNMPQEITPMGMQPMAFDQYAHGFGSLM